MGVVGRLNQYASMQASEFDDYSMSENLLTYSNDFSNVWIVSGLSISSPNVIGVDNLLSASTVTLNNTALNYVYQNFNCSASTTYTFSFYVKIGTFNASNYKIAVYDNTALSFIAVDVVPTQTLSTTSWTRVSYSFTTPSGCTSARVYPYRNGNTAQNSGTFYLWGVQVETGSVATDYTQTVATAKTRVLSSTTNTNITGLGTYYSAGFDENVGFTTFLPANISPPYDPVYDEFGGTFFGAGQGRYMRQYTDKSVIVYNEIDEVSDFRDIVRTGLVLDLDAAQPLSYKGTGEIWYDLSGNGNNATRTNNGGYGGQVTYNSAGYFDFSMNSPASNGVGNQATGGNGFTMSNVILPTTGGFSLSAFIRRNTSVKAAGDRETIFSNTSSADGWRFGIGSPGYIYYLIGGIGNVGYQEGSLGGSNLMDGNWHMMTAVFDRAAVLGSYTIYGYIDAVSSGSVTITAGAGGNVALPAYTPGVGYGGCCDVFAGQIAQVFAYNRVLTSTEVLQNYNALKHRFGL